MTSVFVLYPVEAKFNMDYYVKTHMPMIESYGIACSYSMLSLTLSRSWKKYGLISWEVLSFGVDDTYQAGARIEWESSEAVEAAASGPEATELMGDIVHYTDAKPTVLTSKVVARSS